MRIKTMRRHFVRTRMIIIKTGKRRESKHWRDGNPHTVGGNVKWVDCCGKELGGPSRNRTQNHAANQQFRSQVYPLETWKLGFGQTTVHASLSTMAKGDTTQCPRQVEGQTDVATHATEHDPRQ